MQNLQKSAANDLKRIVDQIERIDTERKALSADIADKFREAENKGFSKKILRKVLSLRKQKAAERKEEEELLASYMGALGMENTPLGEFAERQIQREMAAL